MPCSVRFCLSIIYQAGEKLIDMSVFFETIQESVDMAHFYTHIAVTLLCWVLVIMAILIDLWDGIYTARKLGEKLHSH